MKSKIFSIISIMILILSIYKVHFQDDNKLSNMNNFEKGIFYYNSVNYQLSANYFNKSINDKNNVEQSKFYLIWMNYNNKIKLEDNYYRNLISDMRRTKELRFVLADEAFQKGFYKKSAEMYRGLAEPIIFNLDFPPL